MYSFPKHHFPPSRIASTLVSLLEIRSSICVVLIAFASLFTAHAQTQHPQPLVEKLDDARAEKTLFLNPEYLAYHLPASDNESDDSAKIPLVIYLHGAGGVGSEIRKITGKSRGLVEAIQRFGKSPSLVVAPQCLRESDKSDERGTWEAQDFNLFLEHVLEAHPRLDPDRVYVTGNSMGGYGCWMWGGHSPQHFAAIAPIVGGIGRGGPKDVTPDLKKWAVNLAKVPVYAFAGAEDKVVPAERSERIVAAIREAGGESANIQVYPEEGHGAARLVFQDKAFFDWLFSQKRDN